MSNKTTEALAVKALEMIAGERMCINNLLSDKDIAREALAAIREVLADHIPDATKMVAEPVKQEPVAWTNYNGAVNNRIKAEQALQNLSDFHQHMEATEPKCSDHPDAPHGFDRNASHSADRYVCECEGWEPPKQEPVAWTNYNGAVNNRLKAAPVQPVKQEPVAHYKDAPHTIYLQTGCDDPEDCECSFNDWGDTTWCADQIHDTDIPYIRADYAAPVQPVQEPVAWALTSENGEVLDCISHTYKVTQPCTVDYDEPLYAAPVRTKDLTDEDLCKIGEAHALGMECEGYENNMLWYEVNPLPAFRAVIAADREKNNANNNS